MLVGFGTLLAVGCGMKNYDSRIEQTVDRMKYERRLDDNLMPFVKGKMEELGIYLRPPKNLAGPTQTFQFAALEAGRFDLENSFIEQDKQSLHILARVDRPKVATKKDAPPQPEPPARGDFNEEVVELVRSHTGAEVELSQFKPETKQVKGRRLANNFLAKTLDRESTEMQIYLYGSKSTPYKVALIFEYPKAEKNSISSKIGLALENFLVGDPARQAFSGGQDEAGDGGEGAVEAGPPI